MDKSEARTILGVGAKSSQDEIKQSYRILIKSYHPEITTDTQTMIATDPDIWWNDITPGDDGRWEKVLVGFTII